MEAAESQSDGVCPPRARCNALWNQRPDHPVRGLPNAALAGGRLRFDPQIGAVRHAPMP